MTKTEVRKLLYVIIATYNKHYERMNQQDLDNLVLAWESTLSDYTYAEGSVGLKMYLMNDTKGFPPVPGQVIDCIHKANKSTMQTMTALEAWEFVRKATCNSIYNSQEEFDKLPEMVQKAVGNPDNLKAWGQLDKERFETVEQSHFIRAYNALAKRADEESKIPPSLQRLISKVTEQRQIETHEG